MKKINISLWTCILIGLIMLFTSMVVSGKIIFLLHPRMVIMVEAAIVALILLLIYDLFYKQKRVRHKRDSKLSMGIFFIPLLSGFIFLNNFDLSGIMYNKPIEEHDHVHVHVHGDYEDQFLDVYNRIHHDKEVVGTNLEVNGAIIKNSKGEYFITKIIMACCAADSQVIGLKCYTEGIEDYLGKICKVKGDIRLVSGEMVLYISKIEKDDEIKNLYIYR
ncbi:TIGR03943 family putative permease subunit [Oceanirhabdus sp. W0125-5]|uniref:TIGR03943 family putative permease subunit n=1 Tax=Oceanirhabdus sp. W0125-5 TaxID=2999116 RepID=UPI0022F2BBFE|nr:DUF1980 domain-containing protein [Oceanirhabdus sp. W0125-5]WBW97356.1 DUF1980 domain-containing protein [Oceanirhabdus sp. W0125-5]